MAAEDSSKLEKSLYTPLGGAFGSNASLQDFEVIAKEIVRKAEELQTLTYTKEIKQRHEELISLIKFLKQNYSCYCR